MQIKVFKAGNMKEAMEQVKNELGQDAVILHTKKYKEGGILGYGSKEVVEVTAAVEEEMPQKSSRNKKKDKNKTNSQEKVTENSSSESKDSAVAIEPDKKPAPIMPNSILAKYKTDGTAAGIELAAALGVKQEKPLSPPIFPSFDTEPLSAAAPVKPKKMPKVPEPPQPFQRLAEGMPDIPRSLPEENTANPHIIKADTTADKAIKPAIAVLPTPTAETNRSDAVLRENVTEPARAEDAAKIQNLENQLAQMKSLLAQVVSKEPAKGVLSLQEALRQQEVDKNILDDMAAQSGVGETLADATSQGARETLTRYLEQTVGFSAGINLAKQGTRIVALIGPTGVGKTTTLAKIAARFVLEQGVSAALITADTYRISAVEQLKTYSDILGLPLEIVYSPNELRLAIRKHEGKQLVLIDTAGRSQHNEYQMQELQDLLKTNSRIEKHLVISSTTKSCDAEDILTKFSVCKPDRIIFTKTDETNSTGLILNLLHKKSISLSYLANGQSVPDDIIPADPTKLADVLLRE